MNKGFGLQYYIKSNVRLNKEIRAGEVEKHGKEVCPDCKAPKEQWFRNKLNTLECLCGKKFYGE